MKITVSEKINYVSLTPEGELDANSSVYLDDKLAELIEAGKVNLHIDGSLVTYISSPGLGVFISYVEELANASGKFVFSSLSENVRDVFSILGLDKLDHLIIVNDDTDVEAHFSQT